jgi:hypothetical protein
MKRISLFLFATVLFITNSCIKNNPDPSWLFVGEWTLEENPAGFDAGELTSNFTDAWVYVDEKLIGVFEVPFKIPILKSGMSNIKIYPAVLNNGISATKKIYPFVEPFIVDAELVQNETLVIEPVTRYYSNAKFTILDFEDANLGFEDSPSSLANIVASNDPSVLESFNGNAFGRVTLTQSLSSWISSTNLDEDLPRGGAEVYLEVDYHNTVDIVTGVLAINSTGVTQNPNVQMNAQDPLSVRWKKIYIELKTIVSGSPNANYFEHSFEAMLPPGETSGVINIDNIKVVRF